MRLELTDDQEAFATPFVDSPTRPSDRARRRSTLTTSSPATWCGKRALVV
jgi:hypothetical protein